MKQKRQKPEKTTAISGKQATTSGGNDSKIREKHTQKPHGLCIKVFEFYTKQG